MIALDEGHVDVVKTLIEAGADVNQDDRVGLYMCTLFNFIYVSAHILSPGFTAPN